jgi:GR25 family glycosyltransferase involved in LPS biosynthesis
MLFRLSRLALVFCVALLGIFLFSSGRWHAKHEKADLNTPHNDPPALAGALAASNSTLGFHKILALSHTPSWRSRALLKASKHAGLDIDIPKQAQWSPELVDAFRSMGSTGMPHPKQGAALAWLAHLDLVKYFIMSDYNTALILEDDVDWDVNIKEQAVRIAEAVRTYTNVTETEVAPYGRWWDILWLGHCAEFVDIDKSHLSFSDPTVVPKEKYNGWTREHVMKIPEGQRFVQRALGPICTFGYAISRSGAAKILQHAGRGQHEAYDLQISLVCRDGTLKCISVNPEIFHQYYPLVSAGYVSEVDSANGKEGEVDKKEFDQLMGSTENIVTSTRCHVIFGKPCMFGDEGVPSHNRSLRITEHEVKG